MTPRAFPALALLLAGCLAPVSLREDVTVRDVAADYDAFFPREEIGLLRPRFGLPTLARRGDRLEIDLLARGAAIDDPATIAARLVGAREHPLALALVAREPVAPGVERLRFIARAPDATGPFDLEVAGQRAPRAVWLHADDPAAPRPLRVAHLSDLHIGKTHPAAIEERFAGVIRDLNAARPDAVVITGDVVNLGQNGVLARRARAILSRVDAPLFVILGNHDIGFLDPQLLRGRYGSGWSNFSRTFHPWRFYRFTLGGWEFVGFDSGASEMSPLVRTRGLDGDSLGMLERTIAGARDRRGVVLFSHAPTRAVIEDAPLPTEPGHAGQMREGARDLERVLLDAAAAGQRVIHLAGHTHWGDLFEARPAESGLRFVHWPSLPRAPTPVYGRAALVTAQSATHAGAPLRESARGWGFVWLELDDLAPRVTFQRYGL